MRNATISTRKLKNTDLRIDLGEQTITPSYSYYSDLETLKARKFSTWVNFLNRTAIKQITENRSDEDVAPWVEFLNSRVSYSRKLHYCQHFIIKSSHRLPDEVAEWIYKNAEYPFLLAFLNYAKPETVEHFKMIQANPVYDVNVFIKTFYLTHSKLITTEGGIDFIYGQDKSFYSKRVKRIFDQLDIIHRLKDGKLLYLLRNYTEAETDGLEHLPDTWLITLAEQFFTVAPRLDRFSSLD